MPAGTLPGPARDAEAAPRPAQPSGDPVTAPEGRAPERLAPPPLLILRRRADFLRAARARRQGTSGFTLQARRRETGEGADPAAIRVGFTCSKKVGNAVARNRAKRRLREVVRAVLPAAGRPGWDYVLIGRPEVTARRPFADLLADMHAALARIHAPRKAAS